VILAGGLVVFLTVRELRTPALVLVYLALVLLAIPLVTHPRAARKALTARTGRYATNTLVMVTAFFAILALGGFVSFENSVRLDVTATRQFTLAPQTKKVVDELKEHVRVRGYFDPEDVRQELTKRRADDFFYEFSRRNGDFDYEFIDPDLKPSQARQDGVVEYPTLVFSTPDSNRNPYLLAPIFFEQEFLVSEQELVSALLISTGEQQKVVYFTTGHRERDSGDAIEESDGFGFARSGLLGDSYVVLTLNLKQVEAIPEDAAVLIIAGPSGSFLVDERDKIDDYLNKGGRAIFLVDDAVSSQLNKVLNNWGVNLPDGTLVDVSSSVTGDPRSPIVRRSAYNPESPITGPLDDTFFPGTAAVQDIINRAREGLPPNPDELNIILTPLALTSPFSCISPDPDLSNCLGEEDVLGPHPIAMAIEALAPVGEDPVIPGEGTPVTSIVVFGDSDFASNKFYFALNNSDFFLNSVGWLAQKYDLISIRAKPQAFRQLIINQKQFDFIRYSSWFLLPTGIVLLAGIAWWRRR
jgi:ABC-type uncharacterized transport system involved in gliding motility auxiliary subunit